MTTHPWWDEKYGFFGDFYIEGDNSLEGHLAAEKRTLEERTHFEVEGIQNLLNIEPKSCILDIPCGYGRHSIELALRGHSVVGMDINERHLELAKTTAHKTNALVTWQKGDMRNIPYTNEFDAVINMFFSFGFFESDEENMQVLKNFYNALKPGGKMLMHTDVNIPRIISGSYKTRETRTLKNGGELHISESYDYETKRINGKWEVENYGMAKVKKYSVRVYDKDEFIDMCKSCGFSTCIPYGKPNKKPYEERSEEIFFVATK